MTNDDKAAMVMRLIPNPLYKGCWYDDSIVWEDTRTKPTEQELADEWVVYQAEEAIKVNNKQVHEDHILALNSGYLHTDGYVYHCSENATIDMVKVLTLFDLDPNEPVTVVTLDGSIRDLTIVEFRALGKALGNYQYSLRKIYWNALQR